MADKTYVCVATPSVKDAFDNKYKSSLPKLMKAAIEAAVNKSSKLTTKAPTDKTAKGFYLDGSVVSLKKDTKGPGSLTAKVSLLMADWPKKSMFAFPSAEATVTGINPKNIDREVEDLVVGSLLEPSLKDDIIPLLEKRAP